MKKTAVALLMAAAVLSSWMCPAQKAAPKVIAHRGFWQASTLAPHNSIASLENAIALGCFGTEFDVWVTADGVPVIHHDSRTQNGVTLKDASYAELTDTGGLLANGEKIPTLDEYLDAWKKSDKKVKLVVEIKSHGTPEADRLAAEKVHAVITAAKIEPSQMEYIAFSRDVCKALGDMKCGVPVAYLEGDMTPAVAKNTLGCAGIDYNVDVLKKHQQWIDEAHTLGMTVNVWTVNDDGDMELFIGAGVDYITTDRPDATMKKAAGSCPCR